MPIDKISVVTELFMFIIILDKAKMRKIEKWWNSRLGQKNLINTWSQIWFFNFVYIWSIGATKLSFEFMMQIVAFIIKSVEELVHMLPCDRKSTK